MKMVDLIDWNKLSQKEKQKLKKIYQLNRDTIPNSVIKHLVNKNNG